jgi:hypothetical protein
MSSPLLPPFHRRYRLFARVPVVVPPYGTNRAKRARLFPLMFMRVLGSGFIAASGSKVCCCHHWGEDLPQFWTSSSPAFPQHRGRSLGEDLPKEHHAIKPRLPQHFAPAAAKKQGTGGLFSYALAAITFRGKFGEDLPNFPRKVAALKVPPAGIFPVALRQADSLCFLAILCCACL